MSEEPVGYLIKDGNRQGFEWKCISDDSEPLYTREQLMPKTRFTQEEFDDFNELYVERDLLSDALDDIYGVNYFKLKSWIVIGKMRENELLIANLWANYNPDNPEETIEIIKPKKWFVVGRDYGAGADIPVLMSISGVIPQYSSIGFVEDIDDDCAYAFDTKEEANQWVTPKMHAVELEVE